MNADVSILDSRLGLPLDHSSLNKHAQKCIADTFNAEHSFIVTNGMSTANKIVGIYACPAGSTIIVDRNCHKSIAHLMMMTNVTPIYLRPTRNAHGMLGGIPKAEYTKAHIESLVEKTANATWPVHAIITNSTYSGLFYNTNYIKRTLDVKSIHFDSAWVPYTHFHPIYQGKAGMSGSRVENKTIYETQSTRELLAACSPAAMIHIKGDVNERVFNQGYMMHSTTWPLASSEVTAAMICVAADEHLINQSIEQAINFRKEIDRINKESNSWFFNAWQPDNIEKIDCWPLNRDNNWHGFNHIDDDHMYLDPIKVTLLTPGIDVHGQLEDTGIPASLVAQFLDENGIIVEKTGHYSLLFLFRIDKTKSSTLLGTLMEFKRVYDANLKIRDVMPELYKKDPDFYHNMRIQQLAQGIHQLIKHHHLPELMYQALDELPVMEMTPYDAFQQVILGNVTECALKDISGKVSANMITPYPPGVPLIMPGEKVTADNQPIVSYLEILCEIGSHYPGFEADIHGVYENDNGEYVVKVLAQ